MTQIMLSVRPEWCVKTLNRKVSVLVVKSVPHEVLEWFKDTSKPFSEMEVFIYCTKGKELNFNAYENQWEYNIPKDKKLINPSIHNVNGKVCFEFVCDRVQEITSRKICGEWASYTETMSEFDLSQVSCVENKEIVRYLKGKNGYSLHISELKVYDTPKELGEFHKVGYAEAMNDIDDNKADYIGCECYKQHEDEFEKAFADARKQYGITRAFQSWGYVEYEESEEK
jgi:hypothetical protein